MAAVGGESQWHRARRARMMATMSMPPTLVVLVSSALAAGTAALGVLPQAAGVRPSRGVIGWANAVAAGLMFGVAYVLMSVGLPSGLVAGGVGAVLGVGLVRATHAATGTGELDLEDPESGAPDLGRRALVADLLHGAYEGVAIGVAMTPSLPLGIAMAVALAVHNIPEAMILTRVVTARGAGPLRAVGFTVGSNLTQPLLAVAGYLWLREMPGAVPWVTGFAVGTLLYLVLVELLPESYHQAGKTGIAVVTALSMGVVVLLAGVA